MELMSPSSTLPPPIKWERAAQTSFPKEVRLVRAAALVALGVIGYLKPVCQVSIMSPVLIASLRIMRSRFHMKTAPSAFDVCATGSPFIAFILAQTIAMRFFSSRVLTIQTANICLVAYGIFEGYSALRMKHKDDPLVKAFYEIAGSKEQFENLPLLPKVEDRDLPSTLREIKWQEVSEGVYRMETRDGRQVMIDRSAERISAYVENLSPRDCPDAKRDKYLPYAFDVLFLSDEVRNLLFSYEENNKPDVLVMSAIDAGQANQICEKLKQDVAV